MGYLLDLAIGLITEEPCPAYVSSDDWEGSEERAAIFEFDAGFSRVEADRMAGVGSQEASQ